MKHENVLNLMSDSLWLATESEMSTVSTVAESILRGENNDLRESFLQEREDEERPLRDRDIVMRGSTAIIPLTGTIMPRANLAMAISGGTSAEKFAAQMNALAANDDVKNIIIRVDSNGGNAHGVPAAAAAVRRAREVKPVYAIAEYAMNSAAYWIASAATKIYTTETANVGSIGVVSVLRFASKEEQERVEVIRSTPGKAAITPYEPLSDEARKKLTSDMGQIHDNFVEAVSINRNISTKEAEQMANGETHLGKQAVAAGFADAEVENTEALLAMIEEQEAMEDRFVSLKGAYMESESQRMAAEAKLSDLEGQVAELQAEIETIRTETKHEEMEAAVDLAISEGRVAPGLKDDVLADLKSGDVKLEAFQRMVSNIPKGTAVPQTDLKPDSNEKADDPLKPATDEEKRMFAMFPALASN